MDSMFEPALVARAQALLEACRARSLRIVSAESCTGGLVAALGEKLEIGLEDPSQRRRALGTLAHLDDDIAEDRSRLVQILPSGIPPVERGRPESPARL